MRPSVARFARVIKRRTLPTQVQENIIPAPTPQTEELKRPNLIDVLMQQKADAAENWPVNIRLEPVVKKEAFKRVQADTLRPRGTPLEAQA
ncbi:hypothetical protein FPV67DRAFT_1662892 [Lyophyllum atratum]|nr:hypothetical protein FPV67DRAFT_1662892 [Lyophyllum atratum]